MKACTGQEWSRSEKVSGAGEKETMLWGGGDMAALYAFQMRWEGRSGRQDAT